MSKKKLQRELERTYNKENLGVLLEPMKDALLVEPLRYVANWLEQDFDFNARPDLIEVVSAVIQLDAEDICWHLMTTVLLDTDISLQAAMGMFFHKIGKYAPTVFRRGHVLNVYVEAICSTGLIETKFMGKYNHIKATVSMGDRGQRNYGYVLPSIVPHKVVDNKHSAYDNLHAITGSKLKRHDEEVCLDHIHRLNSIAYKVETRILNMTKPIFEDTPKYREKFGRYETDEEVAARRKEFNRFERELPSRVNIMVANGNEFYFGHQYCTRLRSYLKAYHFDYIGNKYCRAFVQPKKGALVTGGEEYGF